MSANPVLTVNPVLTLILGGGGGGGGVCVCVCVWSGVGGICYVDVDPTGGVPLPRVTFEPRFLSQGYIFLPKSLAKGIYLTEPLKNGILGLN